MGHPIHPIPGWDIPYIPSQDGTFHTSHPRMGLFTSHPKMGHPIHPIPGWDVEPPDEIRDCERKIFNQYLGDSLTIEKVVSIEDAKRWIVAHVDMEGSGLSVSYVMLRFVSSYLL
jgi:hypothetical protein